MEQWINAITTVGFPIVACIALAAFLWYMINKRITEMEELLKANNEFITTLTKIQDDIADIEATLEELRKTGDN